LNIYFAASIAGGRKLLPVYGRMVDHLKALGHTVLTEHIVAPDVLEQENHFTAAQVYRRDVDWLQSCDAVVAEVSNPSLGVGYEICYALDCKKAVLALHQQDLFISRMITGNDRPGLRVVAYTAEADWRQQINRFLAGAV